MGNNFLDQLDKFQREAAKFDRGAGLVVAGPGSGKTRVLTHRVANLVANGKPLRSILAVTFSNQAAEEMRSRVGRLIGMEPDDLKATIATFHSTGYRMILRNRNQLPFKLSYAPIDLAATSRILRMTAGNREQLGTKLHVKILRSYISLKKREDIDCDQALAQDPNDVYALAYSLFEAEKQKLGILDFDDMIFLAWRLLRDKRVVLLAEQARCEYLMIDEFHDTDITQLRMAQAIAKPQENVLCVCDSNQAIYSWRGADYRICLDFGKYFPEHQKFFLATNYRSLPHIVSLYKETITGCPSLIAGFLEKIFPFRKHPEPTEGMPEFVEFATDNAEAEWVTDSIAKWRAKGERDFAVLYRTNRQACLLEEALFRKEIPYIVLGACSFFNRAEVKDLLAFLRILDNRDDNSALERIVKSQAECSKYLGAAFLRELAKGGDHWFQNLRMFHSHKRFQVDKARGLYDFIEQLDIWTKNQSVNGQLQIIAEESGLMESLLDNEQYEESADNDAAENIPQVIRVAGQFKSRQDFLSYVSRVSAASERRYDSKESPVQLMTVHRAKGKEFGIVYFVGVSDDIIPHKKSQGDPDAVEEEQRIAYVGISRAKDRLYVTCFDQPSRFLSQRFAAGQKIGRVNYAEEQKPLVAVRTGIDPCD